MAKKKVKVIRISAPRDGYRRAGMAHTRAPQDHPAEDFSKEKLAALKADKSLVVVETEAEVEVPDKPEK